MKISDLDQLRLMEEVIKSDGETFRRYYIQPIDEILEYDVNNRKYRVGPFDMEWKSFDEESPDK